MSGVRQVRVAWSTRSMSGSAAWTDAEADVYVAQAGIPAGHPQTPDETDDLVGARPPAERPLLTGPGGAQEAGAPGPAQESSPALGAAVTGPAGARSAATSSSAHAAAIRESRALTRDIATSG